MIPTNRDRLAPHITGRDRFMDGRRHSQRSGLLGTTALYPSIPAMRYYKGGGGLGGIIGSIVMGAVLGAMTGGIGFGLGFTQGAAFMGLEAGLMSAVASGAAMGAVGGLLTGVAGTVLGQKTSSVSEAQYEARDNKVNVRNSVPPRKRILGTALAGGALIYAATTGSNNNYLHMVFPVASHKVAAMREAYFNNIPESNSRFSSYYRLNRHLGAQDQTADSDLVSECSEWTTAHRLRGTAYLYERLTYNQNAWVSGIPATSVITDGAFLYDPRKPHLTLSASSIGSPGMFSTVGAHGFSAGDIVFIRDHAGATYASATGLTVPVEKHYTVGTVPSSSTFTLLNEGGEPMPLLSAGAGGSVCKCGWSNNAQLGVYDYLLSRDGFNCGLDEVHWSTVESGADICDEDVVLGTSETFTVSTTSNVLTLSDLVPWATGTQVYVQSTDALPSPLAESTAYYWIAGEDAADASMGTLASSYANALTNTAIDITDTGSGTHTITVAVSATTSADSDTVTLSDTKTYIETGDKVAVIDEASPLYGQDLYWRNTDYLQGKLYASRADAMDGAAIDITTSETVRLTRVSQARYTINGVLDLSKKPIDILNDLLTACGGVAVYSQGQYRIYPAAPAVSSGTISQNDLRGSISIVPKPARQELVNAVRGTFKSPAAYWEMTDFPPITSAVYEEEDGGARLYKDVALPLTIDGQRAQRIATIALKRARKGSVSFPTTLRKLGVSAWDCLDLNLDIAAITGKKYRVTNWSVQENAGGIDLVLRDESDDIYDWHPVMARMAVSRDLSNLPTPWIVAPPTDLTLQSGTDQLFVLGDGTVTSRIKATWTDPDDVTIVRIEVQAKPSASEVWEQFSPVILGTGTAYISPVTDGIQWDVRIRAINSVGAKSDWTTVANHLVIGKTAPPSDVTGFSAAQNGNVAVFRWDAVPDVDLAGCDIRYGAIGSSWEAKTPLTTTTRGTQITTAAIPPGTWEVSVKAVDTSGNSSAGAASATLSMGNANTVVATSAQAPDWLGPISGFVKHWTGVLVPDSTMLAADMADAELWDAFVASPVASCTYTQSGETVLTVDGNPRLWAAVTAALGPGETAGSASPTLEIATRTLAGLYGPWTPWTIGTAPAGAFKIRVTITPANGVALLSAFTPTADAQPAQEDHASLAVDTSGYALIFNSPFFSTPNVQVTPMGSSALIGVADSPTATGCTVRLFTTGGAAASGTANVTITGPR